MKKIYFQSTLSLRDFMDLCKSNDIQFNLPRNTGTLLCVEIPDDIISWQFLLDNGFDD